MHARTYTRVYKHTHTHTHTHRGDSINDLLERVARAEGDFLNLTEASEHQREQLQNTYALAAKEARCFRKELLARGISSAAERGARRPAAQAHAQCVPVDWLLEFAALMSARGEMIRVLRAMSENDALVDVLPGIESLAAAMNAIVVCHTDKAQADTGGAPTSQLLHSHFGSTASSLNALQRSKSNASSIALSQRERERERDHSGHSAWQIPNANLPHNPSVTSLASLVNTSHTLASTPYTSSMPLASWNSTNAFNAALQREPDELQESKEKEQSSTLLALKPFRDRVEDEVRVLLSLLEAYEGTMNYDFLACTQALYAANQRLKRIAASSR
jgi:hypothetical protein